MRTLSMERKRERKNARSFGQLLYTKGRIGDEMMIWVEVLDG